MPFKCKYLIIPLLLLLPENAISSDLIPDTTHDLLKVPIAWKIAIPAAIGAIACGYFVFMMPGNISFPNDVPIIENPSVPPLWKFRNEISSYCYFSKDVTSLPSGQYYNYVFQQLFVSGQSQFGLPWNFALEAKAGFTSSLGLKYQIVKDKPFNLACRVLAGANPRGFSSSFSVSASHSYQYNHLMITTIISPAIKKGPSWLKATRVEKDTFPLMRPIESPSPPFIWSEDLVLDIPVGFEFGFRNFAFSVYGSYSRYLVNYSQEIVNAGFYENVISFSPRHHFTVGFITSFFRY